MKEPILRRFAPAVRLLPAVAVLIPCLTHPAAGQTTAGNTLVAGAGLTGPQVVVEGKLIVSPNARIEAAGQDNGSGIARWQPLIDGQEPREEGPLAPGPHTAALLVFDRSGQSTPTAAMPFLVDAEAPALRWKTGDLSSFTSRAQEIERTGRDRRNRRKDKQINSPISWTSGINWEPFQAGGDGLRIASDRPQVYLRMPGARVTADRDDLRLEGDQVLWIAAEDDAAGVEFLHLRWNQDEGVLEIETQDNVGNLRKARWPLEVAAAKGR